MSDHTFHGELVGRQITAEFPPNVIGYMGLRYEATAERVARARELFPERQLDEFDFRHTMGGRTVFIDKETRVEFNRVTHDVFQAPNPKRQNIHCFVVDRGNKIHFLRQRGVDVEPDAIVQHGAIVGRQVRR